jgi:hypothetical protein
MKILALVIGAIGAGVLLSRTGPRVIVVTGLLLAALGTALFTGLTGDSGYAGGILPGLVITGAGFGLVFGPAMNLATQGAVPTESGAASAMVNAAQQLGAAIGTAYGPHPRVRTTPTTPSYERNGSGDAPPIPLAPQVPSGKRQPGKDRVWMKLAGGADRGCAGLDDEQGTRGLARAGSRVRRCEEPACRRPPRRATAGRRSG